MQATPVLLGDVIIVCRSSVCVEISEHDLFLGMVDDESSLPGDSRGCSKYSGNIRWSGVGFETVENGDVIRSLLLDEGVFVPVCDRDRVTCPGRADFMKIIVVFENKFFWSKEELSESISPVCFC